MWLVSFPCMYESLGTRHVASLIPMHESLGMRHVASLIPMHESLGTRHVASLIPMHESLGTRHVASLETDECSEGMWFGFISLFIGINSSHKIVSTLYVSHSSTLAILECAVVMEDTSIQKP